MLYVPSPLPMPLVEKERWNTCSRTFAGITPGLWSQNSAFRSPRPAADGHGFAFPHRFQAHS